MNQQTDQDWVAWLGLYRKANNAFYWIDDIPLTDQYAAWASGEPNYFYVNEKCVHIYNVLEKLGELNDLRCNLDEAQKNVAPVTLCQENHIQGGHHN